MAKPDIPVYIETSGDVVEQLRAVRDHLFLYEERLNYVLSHLGEDNFTHENWAKIFNGTVFTFASVTLTAAGWSSNQQSVSVASVTADSVVIVSPDGASYNDYAASAVYCSAQAAGTLTFKCGVEPSSDLTVNLMIAEEGA